MINAHLLHTCGVHWASAIWLTYAYMGDKIFEK